MVRFWRSTNDVLMCALSGFPLTVLVLVPQKFDGLYLAFRGAISTIAVDFHELRVVHRATESRLDGRQIRLMRVCRELHALERRSATSVINSRAVSASRGPIIQPIISLVSASSAVHVQASPAPSGAALAVDTLRALAYTQLRFRRTGYVCKASCEASCPDTRHRLRPLLRAA